jgi:hypothetical protein
MVDPEMPDRMNTPESESELDALLRTALATYAAPKSDSDLARRILVRVSAEAAPTPNWRWLPWAIALSTAACLIALFALIGLRPTAAPTNHSDQAQISRQPFNQIPPHVPLAKPGGVKQAHSTFPRPHAQPHIASSAGKVQSFPKLDVFPTPYPLTAEEQALVAYAARAPEPERRALIEAQKQIEAPITITAIKIQPIEPPEPGGN